jgi:hypothetical protein
VVIGLLLATLYRATVSFGGDISASIKKFQQQTLSFEWLINETNNQGLT